MSSIKVFGVSAKQLNEYELEDGSFFTENKSLLCAGYILQCFFIFILLRDYLITIKTFKEAQRDSFLQVIAFHYCCSCIDNAFLSFLTIWARYELDSEEAKFISNFTEETGFL